LIFLAVLIPLLVLAPTLSFAIVPAVNITTVFHNSNNETKAIMKSSFENQANAYDKLIDIKKLHCPPTMTASGMINDNPELNALIYQQGVLRCIGYLFDANLPPISDSKRICDNEITINISEGQLGTNQTIINFAHEYLQARGIK
jgi:hypothetical protein